MQIILAPYGINRFEVAFDRNEEEIGLRGENANPEKTLTHDQHAEPVSTWAAEIDIAQLNYVGYYQKETAYEIAEILVENQYLFPVLLGGDQSIEDKSVGCCD